MQLDWDESCAAGNRSCTGCGGVYERYGYRRFKMSKFEEYDLYVRNKDFLVQ